jgi:hypothetical protein
VGTYANNYSTDWGISASTLSQEFQDAGKYVKSDSINGKYTIEAAIDLNDLQGELLNIFTSFASTSVTMYWQPSCGNDFLAVRSDFDFTPNDVPPGSAVPEPATLLLFGMGLLGAGAYGRKRQKKEEK